jgi:hypothetical protein
VMGVDAVEGHCAAIGPGGSAAGSYSGPRSTPWRGWRQPLRKRPMPGRRRERANAGICLPEVVGLAPLAYLTGLRRHRVRTAVVAATPGATTVVAQTLT